MDSNERRDGLRDRICANPNAWWRILQDLIAEAPDDQVIERLAYAPLRMTLECGGERLLHELLREKDVVRLDREPPAVRHRRA